MTVIVRPVVHAVIVERNSDVNINAGVAGPQGPAGAAGSDGKGVAVSVASGTVNADRVYLQTQDTAVVGTNNLAFSQLGGASGTTYTAGSGLTESPAGTFNVGAGNGITVNTDDVALASSTAGNGLTYTTGVLAVGAGTGISVAADAVAVDTAVIAQRAKATNNTAGTSTAFAHNLNTRDVIVEVFDLATFETVEVDVVRTNVNTVTVTFASSQSADAYRIVVMG